MSQAEILAWIQVAQILTSAGYATIQELTAFIQQLKGATMTDAALNAILDGVNVDAATREAKAEADAQ